MKRYYKAFLILAVAVIAVQACKRDYPIHSPSQGTGNSAFLKIIHASPNFAAVYSAPDSLNVYIDDSRVNGASLKFNTTYPGLNNGVTYATVPSGSHKVRIVVGGKVKGDSISIFDFQANLAASSYYTLVITDSLKVATRDSSRIFVRDNFPSPTFGSGYMYYRFINAVQNAEKTDTLELYSSRRNQVLFQKILKDSTTPFTPFAYLSGSFDTLTVRKKGSSTALAKYNGTSTLWDQGFYTFYYIGDTAAAKAKVLNIVVNR